MSRIVSNASPLIVLAKAGSYRVVRRCDRETPLGWLVCVGRGCECSEAGLEGEQLKRLAFDASRIDVLELIEPSRLAGVCCGLGELLPPRSPRNAGLALGVT